jgi:hypothetical protein
VKGAATGKTLVFVEAVDYGGNVTFAGCVESTVSGSSSSVTVSLTKAHVFDCTKAGATNGAPCDDGKICTVGESCKDGACQGGQTKVCATTSTDCVSAVCDEAAGGCVAAPAADGTACDDGLNCTKGDSCLAGKCVGTTVDCVAEAGPCRVATGSTCNEAYGGCEYTPTNYGGACDDGLFCTVNDSCDYSGACHGTTRDCNNGGCATNGICDEAAKSCNSTPVATSGSCDDGSYCTTGDHCDANSQCVGTPIVCSGQCTTCNPTTGSCSLPKPVGTKCDDGNQCTTGDSCDANGSCLANDAPMGTVCSDGNPCTTGDACDGNGTCSYSTYAISGTACNDHNDCTTNDVCNGSSSCYGTSAVSGTACNDHNDCTTGDACDGYGSCYGGGSAVNGTPCGAPCKVGGTCSSGYCYYSTYAPTGTKCDDGDCTSSNDMCNGSGTCSAGTGPSVCP